MVLEDDHLIIEWISVNDYGLVIRVTNKTGRPMVVRMDEARIKDSEGAELQFRNIGGAKGATARQLSVPPHGHRKEGYFLTGGALFYPPGPGRATDSPEEIIKLSKGSIGKAVHLQLPVEIGEGRYEYHVSFTLVNVGARPRRVLF